jgi:hypothetical protein
MMLVQGEEEGEASTVRRVVNCVAGRWTQSLLGRLGRRTKTGVPLTEEIPDVGVV